MRRENVTVPDIVNCLLQSGPVFAEVIDEIQRIRKGATAWRNLALSRAKILLEKFVKTSADEIEGDANFSTLQEKAAPALGLASRPNFGQVLRDIFNVVAQTITAILEGAEVSDIQIWHTTRVCAALAALSSS